MDMVPFVEAGRISTQSKIGTLTSPDSKSHSRIYLDGEYANIYRTNHPKNSLNDVGKFRRRRPNSVAMASFPTIRDDGEHDGRGQGPSGSNTFYGLV